ncbi:MAG: hypothetical protein AAB809_01030 [Patescibacteria group bacterium]
MGTGIGSQPGSGMGVAPIEQKEKREIKILKTQRGEELYQFVGVKKVPDVVAYIIEKYGGEYEFPDQEYRDALVAGNPDQIPGEIKDGGLYLFMGSKREGRGTSVFPTAQWKYDNLRPGFSTSEGYWAVSWSVLLLKKKK